MSCLGVHFAIEPEIVARLASAEDDEARMAIIESIEEGGEYDDWSCDTDKALDAIHRCLTDGRLEWANGQPPLNLVILGGKRLYEGDDYIICLVDAADVPLVAAALPQVTRKFFHSNYERIQQEEYGACVGTEDFEYTWESFLDLPAFFERAAAAGRAIIFTADQ